MKGNFYAFSATLHSHREFLIFKEPWIKHYSGKIAKAVGVAHSILLLVFPLKPSYGLSCRGPWCVPIAPQPVYILDHVVTSGLDPTQPV